MSDNERFVRRGSVAEKMNSRHAAETATAIFFANLLH